MMQDLMVLTSGSLNKLPETAPDSKVLNQLKKAGFKELYDKVGSPAAKRLFSLRNRFDELSSEDLAVLRFRAKHKVCGVFSFDGDVPISRIATEVETAKGFGLRLKVLAITRDTGLEEWVLVGERKIGGSLHRFMIARWGAYVEDLATLYQRRAVTLATEAQAKRLQAESERKLERRRRRQYRIAATVAFGAVGAFAAFVWWFAGLLISWSHQKSILAPAPVVRVPRQTILMNPLDPLEPLIHSLSVLMPFAVMLLVIFVASRLFRGR